MNASLILLLVVILMSANVNGQRRRHRPECVLSNRSPGKCRLLSECPEISNLGQTTLCSNSMFGPIICCPRPIRRQGGGGFNRGNGRPNPPNEFNRDGTNPWLPPDGGLPSFPNEGSRNPWLPQLPNNRHGGFNQQYQSPSISQQKCQQYYSSNSNNRVKRQDFMRTIVGGSPTQIGEFPFMAALGWPSTTGSYDYNCGGSLISEYFVVTAAHCASSRGVQPTVVKLGGGNLETEGMQFSIGRIYVHPNYRSSQTYNDIALIQLEGPISITPACLWPTFNINQKAGTAIGYGHTDFGGRRSDNLLKVTLNIFSNEACSRYYQPGPQIQSGLQDSQLCAGDPNQKMDTCQGDSGGPILIRVDENGQSVPYLIGVTSFGQGCAGAAPSIYTRTSAYIRWIESIVWPRG
ncbi:unnamed protein product [Hermetia illucens]|nr:unnamed protein product [Hermetia illucens]